MCAPGDDENLEDMLDNHEFLLAGLGDGVLDPPFIVCAFSVELLLENVGRCGMCMVFGVAGGASFGGWPLPFCIGIEAFSVDGARV